jgi:hypothetical protein
MHIFVEITCSVVFGKCGNLISMRSIQGYILYHFVGISHLFSYTLNNKRSVCDSTSKFPYFSLTSESGSNSGFWVRNIDRHVTSEPPRAPDGV